MPRESMAGSRSGRDPLGASGMHDADPLSLSLAVFERAGDLPEAIAESFPQLWRCVRAVASEWQLALRPPGMSKPTGKNRPVDLAASVQVPAEPPAQSPDFIRTAGRQPHDSRNPLVVAGMVFAFDPLLRMLIALARGSQAGKSESGRCPLAVDLLGRHHASRDLAMQALLHASPAKWNVVRQLDMDRRQLERWADLLLASLPVAEHTADLAFCADNFRRFRAQEPGMTQNPDEHTATHQRLMAIRLAAPRLQSGGLLDDLALETAGLRGLVSCVRDFLAMAGPGKMVAPQVVSTPCTAGISPWLPVATAGLQPGEQQSGGTAAAGAVRPPKPQPGRRKRISWSRLGRTFSDQRGKTDG